MGVFKKLRNSLRPPHADADDEIAYHVEQRTAENLRAGMSSEEALHDAQSRFGNRTLAGERTAEADVVLWLEALKRDIRLAARMLRRTPGVTAMAILSLALGIGANTVVFTLMKQVVLDSLPVPDGERLVILHNTEPELGHESSNGMKSSFSYPLYRDLQSHTKNIFDDILARYPITVSLTTAEQTQRIHGEIVSGNYFQVLGVRPWRGRVFTSADDGKPGAHPVVVLGYGFWKQQFGGNPAILNQKILLNRSPYVVVGISAPAFYGIDISQRADVFVPMAMKAQMTPGWDGLESRLDHWANLIAKLRPGVTPEKASAALSVIYPPLRDQDLAFMHPGSRASEEQFKRKTIELTPGGRGYAGVRESLGNPLRVLMAMVVLVLVITVVNLANLLIARGVARQREMAIRLSVGAGRRVLIRQLLVESLMLAIAGGTFGFALAYAGMPLFLAFLLVAGVLAFTLLYTRWPLLQAEVQLESMVSREAAFLFNNLLLVGIAFSVLWGTLFPILSEAVRGSKITVGPPFFNRVNVPLGLLLLGLTGIGPLIAWRKASTANLRRQFVGPLGTGFATLAVLLAAGIRDLYPLMTFALAGFVAGTVVQEFYRGVRARHRMHGESVPLALLRLIERNRRRYGGYIVHVGVLIYFVAFAGMAFKVEREATLKPGESVELRSPFGHTYTFTHVGISQYEALNRIVSAATVQVAVDGKPAGLLTSEKRQHVDSFKRPTFEPSTEVGIRSGLREDLYLVFAGAVGGTEEAVYRFNINPLVWWVWFGGFVLAFGGIVTMWPGGGPAIARPRRTQAGYGVALVDAGKE